jgi:AcrR family transcriptional regulator
MSPRPDVSEERKDQILDAATDVFAQKGLSDARVDDIVEESGLSKGTLYWYFKSKDEIIFSIFERMFSNEFKALEKMVDAGGTASESLLYYTNFAIEDVRGLLRLRPLVYEFLSWAFRRKFVREAFRTYMNKYMEAIVPIIQKGIDSGEFRVIDPHAAAITLGAIFEGTILLWVYDNTLVDIEKNIREGVTLFLEGLKA